MGLKIFFFLLFGACGWVCIQYNLKVVEILGKSAWADTKFPGGTYSMWKLVGLVLIIIGILTLLGAFDSIFFTAS